MNHKKPFKSTRFDYVKYDAVASATQTGIKTMFQSLEEYAEEFLPNGRAKALVMTKLEEAYMWAGKAIRDQQIETRGAELQEGRGNE